MNKNLKLMYYFNINLLDAKYHQISLDSVSSSRSQLLGSILNKFISETY